MDERVIVVRRCGECPYMKWTGRCRGYCGYARGGHDILDVTIVPVHCELLGLEALVQDAQVAADDPVEMDVRARVCVGSGSAERTLRAKG